MKLEQVVVDVFSLFFLLKKRLAFLRKPPCRRMWPLSAGVFLKRRWQTLHSTGRPPSAAAAAEDDADVDAAADDDDDDSVASTTPLVAAVAAAAAAAAAVVDSTSFHCLRHGDYFVKLTWKRGYDMPKV